MFDEDIQCAMCFEKFNHKEIVFQRECQYRHIFHKECMEELRRHAIGEARCVACPLR
jgi:hypothetical protein